MAEAAPRPDRPRPGQRARGTDSRQPLVQAAREVFERDGFLDARITDITATAGVAAGSFYTYFTSKEDVFAAVMEEVDEEMLHPRLREFADRDDPISVIEAANRVIPRRLSAQRQADGADGAGRADRRALPPAAPATRPCVHRA